MAQTRAGNKTQSQRQTTMWLFTRFGFFSITRSVQEPDKYQIRARLEKDLKHLKHYAGLDGRILETPNSDYRYRIILDGEAARETMRILINDVTYTNFKDTVHQAPDQAEKDGPYMRIWSIMDNLQPGGPYNRNARRDELTDHERHVLEHEPTIDEIEDSMLHPDRTPASAYEPESTAELFDNPEAKPKPRAKAKAKGKKLNEFIYVAKRPKTGKGRGK